MAPPRPDRPCRNKQEKPALAGYERSKASKAMADQQNFEAARPDTADPAVALAKALGQWPPAPPKALASQMPGKVPGRPAPTVESLAQEHGLKLGDQNQLTTRRIKRGKNYSFVRANGSHIRCARTIRRLHAMAVPT